MIKMSILGINLDCLEYQEMYPIFDSWLSNKTSRSHCLSVINVHICVSALFNYNLRKMYNRSDLLGLDSMAFVKWARAFFYKKADRFYAPDLLLQVSSQAKTKNYTFFLYGGYSDAPDRIEEFLHSKFAGIKVVGKYSPPFRQLSPTEEEGICKMINDVKPDFIWVGLGSPKQDIWIHDHLEKIRGSIFMPSGATFDFFSGRIRQAPHFIRNIGFEWLFRLTQDFRRLWVRYTIYNIVFIFMFILQLLKIVSFDCEGYLRFFGIKTRFGNT